MSLSRGLKLKNYFTAFLICGAFLFILLPQNASAFNNYNKEFNGTLTAVEWNGLFSDYVNTLLPVRMNGPLGINVAAPNEGGLFLDVNGGVRATAFSGSLAGTLNAGNVSMGAFGSNTGGGNYSFPGNVGIGTTNPGAKLEIAGTSGLQGLKVNGGVSGYTSQYTEVNQYGAINVVLTNAANNGAIGASLAGDTWGRVSLGLNSGVGYFGFGPGTTARDIFAYRSAANTLTIAGATDGSVNGNLNILGSVGIGTTSPATKLNIYGTNNTVRMSYDATHYGELSTDISGNNLWHSTGFVQMAGDNAVGDLSGKSGNDLVILGDPSGTAGKGVYLKAFKTGFPWYIGLQYLNSAGIPDLSLVPSGGNVGIGTSTPGATLDVNGLIKMRSVTITQPEDVIVKSYLDSALASTTAGIITQVATSSFWQGSMTGNVYNANTGNIGIGTTNPVSALDVARSGTYSDISSKTYSAGATDRSILDFARARGTEAAPTILSNGDWIASFKARGYNGTNFSDTSAIQFYVDGAFSSGQRPPGRISFQTASAGDANLSDRLTILGNGNVGIGTTNPGSKLQVKDGSISIMDGTYTHSISQNAYTLQITATNQWSIFNNYGGGLKLVGTTNSNELNINTSNINSNVDAFIFYAGRAGGFGFGTRGSSQYYTAIGSQWIDNNNAGVKFNTKMAGTTSEAVRIDYTGNVGIGTTGPNDKLSIGMGGVAALAGSDGTGHNNTQTYLSTDNYALANYGLVKTLIAGGSGSSVGYWTMNGNNIYNSNSGNVGIGTTNPGALLDVSGTTDIVWSGGLTGLVKIGKPGASGVSTGSLIVHTPSLNATSLSGLGITGSYGTPALRSVVNINAYGVWSTFAYGSDLAFSTTKRQALNEVMRLTTDGNVGIGNTSPGYRLDLSNNADDSSYQQYIRFGAHNTLGNESGGIIWKGNFAGYTKVSAKIVAIDEGNYFRQGLAFFTGNNSDQTTNASERLRIDMNGNVGIGTTNPVNNLEVSELNAGGVGGIIQISNPAAATAGNTSELRFGTNSSYTSRYAAIRGIDAGGTNNWIELGFVTGNAGTITEKMRIDKNGLVGIGTTGPNDKFSIGMGGVAALAGSDGTGHNNTQTYLSTDNYALANYGLVKTLIAGGSGSSVGYWTMNGNNIYNSNSGNVGIGTTNPQVKLDVAGIGTSNGSTGQMVLRNYSSTYSDWRGSPGVGIVKSHNDTIGINSTTQGGEILGQFYFGGVDAGNSTYSSSIIQATQVGAAGTGAGSIRNSLDFLMSNGSTYVSALFINKDGNVGIGTTDPGAYRLKVAGDVAITGALLTQTGSDFAEEFKAPSALEAGTVVVMGDEGYKSVKSCTKSYDKTVVGIVSDNPSIIAGRTDIDNKNPEKVIVAMMGVVSVKVTDINGHIEKGDLLTSSGVKGYAMKVSGNRDDRSGTIIGKALENLNTKTGKIKVLVNLQ